jgi:hypothetical protein
MIKATLTGSSTFLGSLGIVTKTSAINFADVIEPLLNVWLLGHELQGVNNPICHHAAQGTKASTAINAVFLL